MQNNGEVVYTCMTSDFFLEEADDWRAEAWEMIRKRPDLHFAIITKRIARFPVSLPDDWGDGYDNVTIICTCENQEQADIRLPVFLNLPIQHREIIEEPMLGEIHIEPYLSTGKIEQVTCGGESGEHARVCKFDWILQTRKQCVDSRVKFHFKQTGARFYKGDRLYSIDRKLQMVQAKKAGIDYAPSGQENFPGMERLFEKLSGSKFRSRFYLGKQEMDYIRKKGMDTVRQHAEDFVRKRLAPALIDNDGRQTPMRGHPVFLAQHATATCCRGCLFKWHGIPPGRALTLQEQEYIVCVIMEWIARQIHSENSLK